IRLVVRNTTFNRLQRKMNEGNIQLYSLGWLADYPDPENFLFLLYGPNGKVEHGGANVANYDSDEFNALYEDMRILPDGPERREVIEQMVHIVRRDAPWVWGFHPRNYTLNHAWLGNRRLNTLANNTLKYLTLDGAQRARRRVDWNRPMVWPLAAGGGLLILVVAPAVL